MAILVRFRSTLDRELPRTTHKNRNYINLNIPLVIYARDIPSVIHFRLVTIPFLVKHFKNVFEISKSILMQMGGLELGNK